MTPINKDTTLIPSLKLAHKQQAKYGAILKLKKRVEVEPVTVG